PERRSATAGQDSNLRPSGYEPLRGSSRWFPLFRNACKSVPSASCCVHRGGPKIRRLDRWDKKLTTKSRDLQRAARVRRGRGYADAIRSTYARTALAACSTSVTSKSSSAASAG